MVREPWLVHAADPHALEQYLMSRGLVRTDDLPIEVSCAGAGNMNLVLRVTTAQKRSFVLKQGRPWVEKYPQIAAPFERTLVEAAFYAAVQSEPSVARSKAVSREAKVSATISVRPSAVTTMPFGNSRSSATLDRKSVV